MSGVIKHLFILNPKSFWNKWKWDHIVSKIQNFFETAGAANCSLHVSQFPREAISYIRSYARKLSEGTTLRVYAVGGDGIMFDCLNGIMGLESIAKAEGRLPVRAELAVMPYGHTNDFIRGFGKKNKKNFRNIEQQFSAPVIPMDVLRVGNNYALNYCSVGLESVAVRYSGQIREYFETGNAMSRWLNRRFYTLNYLLGGLIAGMDKKLLFQEYTIDIDGEILKGAYSTIGLFNGKYYGGGMYPIKNAIPNDGILDILLTRSMGLIRTFSFVPFYMTGRSGQFPGVFTSMQGRKININSESPVMLSMDGEVFFDNHLTLELLPGALQFVDASFKGIGGITDE